jgi:uncharacterized protein YraI
LDTYLVTASALNLRSTAKLTSEVIGSFKRGTVVGGLNRSEDGLWMEVAKGSKTGWVFAKYLTKQGEEQTPVVEHEEFPWMSIATSEIGQKEVPGDGSNPRVLEYLRSTALDAKPASTDATFWCSALSRPTRGERHALMVGAAELAFQSVLADPIGKLDARP